ncbi:MAG: ABC transporter ATP-binding protein [Bacteroidales bacterium]|nr:ABC transporter ATP-binding protein [Bacteroidales bacterium]
MTNSPAIITIKDVHKSFKDVHAVRGLSFNLAKGEFLALLGPNGAGKTTMVEMIEGIQKPDSGEILIKDMNWSAHNHNKLNRILGISLQETWFIEKLTVKETLMLFASFYKLDYNRVAEIIAMVRLEEKKNTYVKNLSGGQRQRLAIGISLINYPEILLLDEPTTGLDPTARREIWNILVELKREKNISMILTTHYMEEAERLCDRIIIIDHGKILARGTLDELLDQCGAKEIIEVAFDKDEFDFGKLPGVFKVQKSELNVSLEVEKIVETLPVLLKMTTEQKLKINTLECRKVTLDDLFISMTGRHLTES